MSANHVLNRLAWTIVLSLACLSNARAEPLPEFYGVYAVDGGQIHELKFVKTTTLQLSPTARVVVFDKNIGIVASPGSVEINRMILVRNEIDLDGGGFNAVGFSGERPNNPHPKIEASRLWQASGKERNVELRSKPVPNQPEMLVFAPRDPFPAGHYAVLVNDKFVAAFWVGPIVDGAAAETIADCFDRESWATLSGRRQQLLPCSGSGAGARGRKDAAGVAGSAAAPASSAATSDLTALLQKSPAQPQQPDKRHEEDSIGVVLEYPADYELTTSKQPVIATLLASGRESTDPTATKITVTMSRDIPRLIPLSLDASVQSTLNGTRAAMAESTVVGPVPTTMNNVDAQIFLVTGKEEGVLKKKAVTIAVVDRKVMGVVLHATPETFDAAWDGYRRVVASYTKK